MSAGTIYRNIVVAQVELERVCRRLAQAPLLDEFGRRLRITIERLYPNRTSEQNALMWALLADIAAQVEWYVDGRLQLLGSDEWKVILTAGLRKTQRIAAGIEGGFVMLGTSTSAMSKAEMSELIELILAFGSQRGVVWSREPDPISTTAAPAANEPHHPERSAA